jgi:hypothetical protein
MARVVLTVHAGARRLGREARAGETCSTLARKADAIAEARREAFAIYCELGLAQVVVRGRNGTIQTEWTYGADPRRTKG